ncbi:Alpha N-terminal protein methyltransferase 1 [Acorus gramineus]|uniref:Alpha N-terminal protein methyltransferase 1 n=1 Tax=Acorus gramineus TaxID=55184 RepID=A0AAV9BQW4_ACOGR|nr:Alpha N-terminal protein methyltransferase 1 [Acorus gramineus]
MADGGFDSDGRSYNNAHDLWVEEIGGSEEEKRVWYNKGISYWQSVEASMDGVLGGFGHLNETDVKGSEDFLKTLLASRGMNGPGQHLVALDCGSGVGRVTKNLLLRYFNEVDLVEPVKHLLEAAHGSLASENNMIEDVHKAVNFYCLPLQEFTPEVGRYDVIWIQWCIGQLTDDDFIAFFERAKAGLKPHGFFFLKENFAKAGFVYDKEDHSITRSIQYFKDLFEKCGLHVIDIECQEDFPGELFAVKMFALEPEETKRTTESMVEKQSIKHVTDKRKRFSGGRKKKQSNMPAVIN